MPGSADVLIASLASGGFALLGVGLSNLMASRRQGAAFRTETALELASNERYVWAQDWIELQIDLERVEARLAVAGVPGDLVTAFRDISEACWRDRTRHIDPVDPDERVQWGIREDLLEGRRLAQRAIRAELLRNDTRDSRIELVERAIEEIDSLLPRRSAGVH
jgi:hypothetical protein